MSHLSCIGLTVGDKEAFGALIDYAVAHATDDAPARAPARHVRWTDASGAALVVHLADAQTIECITPYFVAPEPTRWRVRTSAPADDAGCAHCGGADCDIVDGSGELVTRTTVQWLHYQPYREWLGEARDERIEVVAFAHRAAFYATTEAFEADQESWWPGIGKLGADAPPGRQIKGFADVSFLPEGMFAPPGDMKVRASCMFAGRVEAVARPINGHTKRAFLHVRVATLPGAIDVVADEHEGTPEVGGRAVVRAWLVGRPETPPPARRGGWLGRLIGR